MHTTETLKTIIRDLLLWERDVFGGSDAPCWERARQAVADEPEPAPPPETDKVPDGYVLVPREPTKAMMDAGLYHASHDATWADVHTSWKAMVDMVAADPNASPAEGQS
jgi:hypothetical protein